MSPDEAELVLQRAAEQARKNEQRHARETPPAPFRAALASAPKPLSPDAIAEHERRQEEYDRRERVVEARKHCRVPDRYVRMALNNIAAIPADTQDAYGAVAQRLQGMISTPALVAMIGGVGTGKTAMACGLVNAFVSQGRSARYLKAWDYILAVRKTWGSGSSRSQDQVEADHVRQALLVLDEMQVRGETTNEDMLLLRLIDLRYDAQKATLLVSNHATREELNARLDGRLTSRMRDRGGLIVCSWKDLRGRLVTEGSRR